VAHTSQIDGFPHSLAHSSLALVVCPFLSPFPLASLLPALPTRLPSCAPRGETANKDTTKQREQQTKTACVLLAPNKCHRPFRACSPRCPVEDHSSAPFFPRSRRQREQQQQQRQGKEGSSRAGTHKGGREGDECDPVEWRVLSTSGPVSASGRDGLSSDQSQLQIHSDTRRGEEGPRQHEAGRKAATDTQACVSCE
jgi:hypothetical protein